MDRIVGKNYLRIKFTLTSPLALSSGENDITDKDLMKDSNGVAYIPASSIAGVVREYMKGDKKVCDKYFGYVLRNVGHTESRILSYDANPERKDSESRILFYDANPERKDSLKISIRDSVALDEYKTAKIGAKFDMEVLEAGATFVTYIEQNIYDGDIDYTEKITKAINKNGLRFGGKTMRGYGNTKIDEIKSLSFVFSEGNDLNRWLKFDLYTEEKWANAQVREKVNGSNRKKLCIGLVQNGGLSVRKYTTEPSSSKKTVPDMETMKSNDPAGNKVPVIPGTTWAGAFRSRMREFGIDEKRENVIFGYVKGEGKDEKSRSRIRFGESYIVGGYDKQLSRNAIDRFSGGTVDGALFTERTHYGGTTTLEIEWCGKDEMMEEEKKALAATIADLHFGFLAVGGETSVGRGLFEITKINNNELKDSENGTRVFEQILNAVQEVM